MISGFTIARNVVKLKYPILECLTAMRPMTDEIVVGYDPYTDDGTHELMVKLSEDLDLRLFESKWDMENFEKGTELGIQTDKTMEQLRGDWQLYVQLDEAFHEDDADLIRAATAQPSDVTGVDFIRAYFFGNLHTIRKDWSVQITRLTRAGTHTYADFDGMNCKLLRGRHEFCKNVWMYHYSRIGDADEISLRLRNLDGFYHADETLVPKDELTPYDFKTRQWDNFSKVETPPEVDTTFVKYLGTHPLPFAELYQDYE